MARALSREGESKQGLVVTLVIFVLLTIGTAVAAYLGFSGKDKLQADVKKAQDEKKRADDERDWFRFQVGVYRAYLGTPAATSKPSEPKQGGEEAPKPGETRIGDELVNQKRGFDAGTLGKDYDDYKPVKNLIEKTLGTLSKWDPAKNLPEKSFVEILTDRNNQINQLRADLRTALDEAALAKKEKTDALALLKAAEEKFTDRIENPETGLKAEFQKDRQKYIDQLARLTKQLEASGEKSKPLVDELQQKLEQANKEKNALDKKIRDLEGKVAQLQTKLETSTAVALEKESAVLEPRGEIVRVHTNLRRATINFGRNAGLKPGITFSVHGKQADGKPKRLKKADVQVVSVDARTAEVEITDVVVWDADRKLYDRIDVLSPENKDPVIKGDVLINPLWNPNAKTHVALAGVFDFVGVNQTQMNSFVRRLEDQNIIVDAYVDLSDGKIKGPGLTRQTEYILRGGEVDGREAGAPRDKETLKEVNDNIKKLLQEANRLGVEVMRPERFLRDTGYPLPRRSPIQD
jgi:hypothetical protein